MPKLLPTSPNHAVWDVASKLAPSLSPELRAAVWLYVDDLERSHEVSQGIEGPVGAYWHGIMHRREGDFWNAKYWLRQARELAPVMASIPKFEPLSFVDRVQGAGGSNPVELVELQRAEWMALLTYCMQREDKVNR